MPELRRDPIVGRWVIIAAERDQRPTDFKPEKTESSGGPCPFCPGNEARTPPEVYAERPKGGTPDGANWTVRVVSNKFPALQIEGELDPATFLDNSLIEAANNFTDEEVKAALDEWKAKNPS